MKIASNICSGKSRKVSEYSAKIYRITVRSDGSWIHMVTIMQRKKVKRQL